MKAMILAAGRGERMRPLTDHCPKPLLAAGGKPLIVWHIERLAAAGFHDLVINHAHLGHMLEAALGDGRDLGVRIRWSAEPPGALETAGGIRHALPLLGDTPSLPLQGDAPFLVVNGDTYVDWDFHAARQALHPDDLAHLVLVANPPHNPQGDFALVGDRISNATDGRLTFSGIGIYRPTLFAGLADNTPAKLAPLLRAAADAGRVGGSRHRGRWEDIGTPERLAALDQELRTHPPEAP